MKILLSILLAVLLQPALADHPTDLDHLLKQLQQSHLKAAQVRKQRETEFFNSHQDQQQALEAMRAQISEARSNSEALKTRFENGEAELAELDTQLQQASEGLGELFGTVRQSANDLQALLADSLVSTQYPERAEWFRLLAEARALPDINELERVWLLMQHEIQQTGMVSRFSADVVLANGEQAHQLVTRIGSFVAISQGHYLTQLPDSERLAELPRQPGQQHLERANNLESANGGYHSMTIDPTRGALLNVLVQAPTLQERLHQGGLIGYIILGLGAAGLLLALTRLLVLMLVSGRMQSQLKAIDTPKDNNPLGRVLLSVKDIPAQQLERIELQLDEAILRELPALTRGQSVVKLLAAVAPLLGLLGTVTGMILTFQSISLFGTGDPKLMASGISQALITTVLGLVTAIPLLFCHNLLASRSKQLTQILDEQSAGLQARSQND